MCTKCLVKWIDDAEQQARERAAASEAGWREKGNEQPLGITPFRFAVDIGMLVDLRGRLAACPEQGLMPVASMSSASLIEDVSRSLNLGPRPSPREPLDNPKESMRPTPLTISCRYCAAIWPGHTVDCPVPR